MRQRARLIAAGLIPLLRGHQQEAIVHSVFEQAGNLLLESDTFLALTSPFAARVPNGIVIDPGRSRRVDLLDLEPGMKAYVGNATIRVPDAGVEIATTGAASWDPRPQFEPWEACPSDIADNTRSLAAYLKAHCERAHLGKAALRLVAQAGWDPEAGFANTAIPGADRVAALAAALSRGSVGDVAAAARGLAGLGPGLTPSGDDFLIGVCGALFLMDSMPWRPPRHHRSGAMAAIAAAAVDRTTLLSSTWLTHAACGEFTAELGALLVATTGRGGAGLVSAASRVAALGSSSGLDTIAGLVAGVISLLDADSHALSPDSLNPGIAFVEHFPHPCAITHRQTMYELRWESSSG